MALSYYGINENQETLGQALRPYQVENGDNDDKSVTLEEMAEKAKESWLYQILKKGLFMTRNYLRKILYFYTYQKIP